MPASYRLQPGTAPRDLPALYDASMIVPEFADCKNVMFTLFNDPHVHTEKRAKLYQYAIENYNDMDEFERETAEDYIKSLFTAEQILDLRAYTLRAFNIDIYATQVILPTAYCYPNYLTWGGGGPYNVYHLHQTPGYNLLFDVLAYYDLSSQWEDRLKEIELIESAYNAITILRPHKGMRSVINVLQEIIDTYDNKEWRKKWDMSHVLFD